MLATQALNDLELSDGACRLLLLLLRADLPDPFPLSHRTAGKICGLIDKKTVYARIKKLSPAYLEKTVIQGCPPTSWFTFKGGKNATNGSAPAEKPAAMVRGHVQTNRAAIIAAQKARWAKVTRRKE